MEAITARVLALAVAILIGTGAFKGYVEPQLDAAQQRIEAVVAILENAG